MPKRREMKENKIKLIVRKSLEQMRMKMKEKTRLVVGKSTKLERLKRRWRRVKEEK